MGEAVGVALALVVAAIGVVLVLVVVGKAVGVALMLVGVVVGTGVFSLVLVSVAVGTGVSEVPGVPTTVKIEERGPLAASVVSKTMLFAGMVTSISEPRVA